MSRRDDRVFPVDMPLLIEQLSRIVGEGPR